MTRFVQGLLFIVLVLAPVAAFAGAGFYDFTAIRDGNPVVTPARFSMVVVKRGDDWLIAHHHSSRRPEPPK